MIEKEISIRSNDVQLSGTICLPKETGRFPAVLMIHGSGPLDRDENMKAQQLNVFNTIAHHLAKEGFASLRYDKRGCGKSGGNFYKTGHFDLVEDVVNAFDALSQMEFCEKVFVLGHSEGCIIAPQVSLKRTSIAGLILLCPFADTIESVLMKQAAQLEKEFEHSGFFSKMLSNILGANVKSQRKLIDSINSSNAESMRNHFQKVPAKSFRELMSLDPRSIFSQVTQPMLIIGGEKDLQCEPADVDRIAKLVKYPVEAHVITNLTHILRFDEGEPSMLGVTRLIKKPMEPIVPEMIAKWLKQQTG